MIYTIQMLLLNCLTILILIYKLSNHRFYYDLRKSYLDTDIEVLPPASVETN